jgi:dTDP-4-dehydrorhamnose 3,5-epimerase
MLFCGTSLQGAMLIRLQRREDNRGFFARTMCRTEFDANGLVSNFLQSNHSHNNLKGTLRGMHFQYTPHSEAKLVRCVRGAVYDVIVDLRRQSPTYKHWEGFELTADNGYSLYVPMGFAHGFVTLSDDSDLIYQVSHPYTPSSEGGLRYDDPAIAIKWPVKISQVSSKDASWALFTDSVCLFP